MPQREFFTLRSGHRIAALDWGGGEKPLAILCHANGFCASSWSTVAKLLQQDLRVVALDARGHGASSVPLDEDLYDWEHLVEDLLDVTDQLLAKHTLRYVEVVVGNSLGAVIGAVAAAREPANFRTVVMLDPPILPRVGDLGASLGPEGRLKQTRRRRREFNSREELALAYRRKKTFANWCDEAFEHYLNDGFSYQADGRLILRCLPEVEAAIFEKTGSLDLFAEAKTIQADVTLVHATQGLFPYEGYQSLNEQFPHGVLTSLHGGHLLPMELPEKTAEIVLMSL